MKIKKHNISKRRVICLVVCMAVFCTASVVTDSMASCHDSQMMAQRWSCDGRKYAQISVFYPNDPQKYNNQEVEKIRQSIHSKLDKDSYKPLSENAQVWTDAYCSQIIKSGISVDRIESGNQDVNAADDEQTVKDKGDTSENTQADNNDYDKNSDQADILGSDAVSKYSVIAVAGDFFEFHPLSLIKGNYIYESALSTNTAVVDEKAAWNMYSSVDVIGLPFYIADKEFTISGVVKSESDRATNKIYPSDPVVYIQYKSLTDIGQKETLMDYEAVLPDPVSNYAKNILLFSNGIDSMTEKEPEKKEKSLDCVIIDNTNRYSKMNLYKALRSFDSASAVVKPIAYPYWENAARITMSQMTVLFFLRLVSAAVSFLIVTAFLLRLNSQRKWHLKDFTEKLMYKYTYKKRVSDYIHSYEGTESDHQKKGNNEHENKAII